MILRALATTLLGALLIGCQPALVSSDSPPTISSICDIQANPERYIGASVRLKTFFVSDTSYYSYFTEGACAKTPNSTLKMANKRLFKDGEKTVVDFIRASYKQCGVGITVCPVRASVELDGTIANTDSGELGIIVTHVYSYAFDKRKQESE